MTPPRFWHRRWWVAAAAIVLLFWCQFAWVSPTNFHGFDEWVILWLVSRGILSFPYANRPMVLVWNLPTRLTDNPVIASYVLHGTYLALTGILVFLLVRRLAPDRHVLAWMAGVFAATWAPRDRLRLDAVHMLLYSGLMVGVLLSLLLLAEWWGRRRWWLLAGGCALALVTARGYEGAFPLLMGAPLLLALVAPFPTGWRWAVPWYAVLGIGLAQLLDPVLAVSGSLEYQRRVARSMDLDIAQVAGRLWQHYGFELLPLARTPWQELLVPAVLPALAVWIAAAWMLPRDDASVRDRRVDLAAMVVGLTLAGLGWAMFLPIPSLTTPDRTQFLPAPGIALFLAAAVVWVASWLPAKWRPLGVTILGGWVLWVGTAGVLSLQRQWEVRSAFPGQIRFLGELTRLAPDLRPNTLVIAIDHTQSWHSFGLRHAIDYMYDGRASGYLWASLPNILYTTRFTDAGVVCEPVAAIRGPWRSPATVHRYDELVVVLYAEDRTLAILDDWPSQMPRLPQGATYAPRARIVPGSFEQGDVPEPRSRAVLR